MLRWTIPVLVVMTVVRPVAAAEQVAVPHAKRHARAMLPAGLPRPHYKFRTTIAYPRLPPPPPVVVVAPPVIVGEPLIAGIPGPDALISAWSVGTPLLPGSSTLPGYYGRAFDYDYQGPYYGGGPYPSYFFRLPYACGVYGYC